MSYQVLARKWRPRRFQEMVGQAHVLKALVNALDDDRLHHAYLFTGTRGVGKTSLARLFAKALNCEQGVSSTPCGECSACRAIAEGRFVDLIEVDAASRTKVEDTRDLLENVQYAPTQGRYKVYLIDEVHMLSTHSFNALLKTLEEPPPHVKFLLATTDPQKLPVTILSRCLQFNLKNMIPERIVDHLKFVLGEEQVPYEQSALWLLARSADGSMRDAMSLTDQAIAFGAGEITEVDVRAMLGTIDQRLVYQMLECLAEHNAQGLLDAVKDLAQYSPDYNTVLGDLISLLHRIAVGQVLPDAVDNSMGDMEQVKNLASRLSAEDLQLYYQVALMGRKDLPFVPDAREGLEMVLLRMLAFRPAGVAPGATSKPPVSGHTVDKIEAAPAIAAPEPQTASIKASAAQAQAPAAQAQSSMPAAAVQPGTVPVVEAAPVAKSVPVAETVPEIKKAPVIAQVPEPAQPQMPPSIADIPPWEDIPAEVYEASEPMDNRPPGGKPAKKPEPAPMPPRMAVPVQAQPPAPAAIKPSPGVKQSLKVQPSTQTSPPLAETVASGVLSKDLAETLPKCLAELKLEDWAQLAAVIGLKGMAASLANNLSLESKEDSRLVFHYNPEQKALLNETQRERISGALKDYFETSLEVEFVQSAQTRETPDLYLQRKKAERLAEAVESIKNDETVQRIQQQFDAEIDLASVEPIDTH
ncbi:MAG: DNA polymerase III subunit gamma/tau [Pontibacterium sp.]